MVHSLLHTGLRAKGGGLALSNRYPDREGVGRGFSLRHPTGFESTDVTPGHKISYGLGSRPWRRGSPARTL